VYFLYLIKYTRDYPQDIFFRGYVGLNESEKVGIGIFLIFFDHFRSFELLGLYYSEALFVLAHFDLG
jgi:hypothetical protein